MAFASDPRLRQHWNRLTHTTESAATDAAASLWSFGHTYVGPCLASAAGYLDACCAAPCLGDRDERARRARERDRGARRLLGGRNTGHRRGAEYSFDFYDDWEEDLAEAEVFAASGGDADGEGQYGSGGGSGGGGGGGGGGRGRFFRGEDWDRLLAGTGGGGGNRGRHGRDEDVTVDEPRRKRGMSYGTRGLRKVSGEEDPNVIPRTAPLGFLGRLPFNIVGSLRYKPSAANLREHPGGGGPPPQGYRADGGGEEHEPLLGGGEEALQQHPGTRPRSDTATSGDTSSSYRSRGDLFPSDGEGDEDAVPLDDEFTVALERIDDRGSTKTRSSKGKRAADADRDKDLSRTFSRTTISSSNTPDEFSNPASPIREMEDTAPLVPTLEDLQREEEEAEREEQEERERRRRAATQLAEERGLSKDEVLPGLATPEGRKDEPSSREPQYTLTGEEPKHRLSTPPRPAPAPPETKSINDFGGKPGHESNFVPARLPHFG